MKKGRFLFLCLFLNFLFVGALAIADELTESIETRVLESFSNPDTSKWIVVGSKFVTKDYPQYAFVDVYPVTEFGKKKDDKQQIKSLGIHAKFDRQGYNYLEIIPVADSGDGKTVPRDVDIPGRVKDVTIWVWGSNYDFYLQAYLEDYRGISHVIDFGSIKYIGWKKLTAHVPSAIPQAANHIPKFQGLKLTKLVIWTRPYEDVNDFYIYLDQMKILTDLYESPYDGEDLGTPEGTKEIWDKTKQGK